LTCLSYYGIIWKKNKNFAVVGYIMSIIRDIYGNMIGRIKSHIAISKVKLLKYHKQAR